jgi:hypothetical protein
VLAVMCLLAWMPGPATAAGKPLAWAVILYPVVMFAVVLLMAGHVGDIVSKQPGVLFSWAVGGLPGGKEAMIPGGAGVVYSVLVGYGLATVFGKQLE